MPWTAPAVLAMVPIHMKIQARDQPVMTARSDSGDHAEDAAAGAVAHEDAHGEGDAGGEGVAGEVGQHRSGERARSGRWAAT